MDKIELPKYKSHKEVYAIKINKISTSSLNENICDIETELGVIKVSKQFIIKHDPKIGGYYVQYQDGYESYSPASAFEEGYSLVHND